MKPLGANRKSLLLTSGLIFGLMLSFQHCSRVDLKRAELDSNSNQMQGYVCHPGDVSTNSQYQLSDFYVINLTARSYQGKLVADSNLNGIVDTLELAQPVNTVAVNSSDTDEDGILDFIENLKGLNSTRADANIDGIDLDGLTNKQELQQGRDPDFTGDEPSVDYSVQVSEEINNCGQGQSSFAFTINRLSLVSVDEFTDEVNSGPLSLSHQQDENVILLVARMSSMNAQNEDLYFVNFIRNPVNGSIQKYVPANEFFILGSEAVACSTCDSSAFGKQYAKIAAGDKHSCAVSQTGDAICWGFNYFGQLGDGSTIQRKSPVKVQSPASLKDIKVGESHTCALASSEDVYCWGNNSYGQLGNGDFGDSQVPVKVNLPGVASKIALGANHSCAELKSGGLYCWGRNHVNQLNDGTSKDSATPLLLSLAATEFPLLSLSAGENHSCAVEKFSRLTCWGYGSQSTFISFKSLHKWTQVVTNGTISYGIDKNVNPNKAVCWSKYGANTSNNYIYGCGLVAETSASTDEYTQGIQNVLFISLGGVHTCAIYSKTLVDGTTKKALDCWGGTGYGQTTQDYNPLAPHDPTPQTIFAVKEPIDVSAGIKHTCSIDKDGILWCWGSNSYGQLGTGNLQDSQYPVKVANQ